MYVLYRFYSAAGDLLYIGSTLMVVPRIRTHRRNTPWFSEIAKIALEPVEGNAKGLALRAERLAVFTEQPKYNVMYKKAVPASLRPPPVRRPVPHAKHARNLRIRTLELCGYSLTSLAKMFKISRQRVFQIVSKS